MSARFITLFERSRYSTSGRDFGLDEAARNRRMEQHERFAVGMIGFAIEHDPEFRSHFLDKVCGFGDIGRTEGWEVLVEPENWGDLVLKHRASRSLVVTEFKIDAPLKPHQDPSNPQFNLPANEQQCAGYGWEIARIARSEKWVSLKYAAVQKKVSWSSSGKFSNGLECTPLEWQRLLRHDVSEESELESDCYDCLGYFGVVVFISRRMNKMTIADKATQPLALMIGVLQEFQVEFSYRLLKGVDSRSLGLEIEPEDFPRIGRVVQPTGGNAAGWFGYEIHPANGPRLSIWFYCCYSTNGKSPAKQLVHNTLCKAGFEAREFQEDGDNIGVFRKAEDSAGDKEWFCKVLSAF